MDGQEQDTPNEQITETEEGDYASYTTDELFLHAQGNTQALFIATAAYLQERGHSVDDWVTAVGTTFVRAWDTATPWDADDFMDAMLINFRSLGAEVVSAEFAPDQSSATVRGLPDPAALLQFGVESALGDRYNDVAAPIARALGLNWSWTRDGDDVRYLVTRTTG